MNEPTPSMLLPVLALLVVSVGVYVLFAALALEFYPLVFVAAVCFALAFAPALKLVKRR